jgi:hypothetical protein
MTVERTVPNKNAARVTAGALAGLSTVDDTRTTARRPTWEKIEEEEAYRPSSGFFVRSAMNFVSASNCSARECLASMTLMMRPPWPYGVSNENWPWRTWTAIRARFRKWRQRLPALRTVRTAFVRAVRKPSVTLACTLSPGPACASNAPLGQYARPPFEESLCTANWSLRSRYKQPLADAIARNEFLGRRPAREALLSTLPRVFCG